jgi:PST family polysaccharide transporter
VSDLPLRRSAAQGFIWNVLGAVFRSLSGFAVNVILSRLLGPAPFGTMAVVLTLLSFSTLVLDSGLSVGLIQRQELTDEDIDGIQGFQLLVGVLLAAAVWLLAYPLAAWFGQPELLSIAPYIALMIVVTALSQVPQALLRRRLDFRALQQAQMWSYLIGYVGVGLLLAFQGAGLWSLIAAQLVQLVVNLGWTLSRVRQPFRPRLRGDRALLTFGARVLGTNLINWLTLNADTFAIGSQFGKARLGVYNRMNFLLGTPLGILTSSLQSVLVSTVSRVQAEPSKVKDAYLAVVELVAWVALPLFLSLAFVGATLVEGVYGPLWLSGHPLVPPICIVMAVASLGMLPGPVMTGLGRVDIELKNTALNLCLSLPLIGWAALNSVTLVAWAVALSRLSFCLLLNRALGLRLGIGLGEYFGRIVRPLGLALVLGGTMRLLDTGLLGAGIIPAWRLLTLGLVGAAVYAALFLHFPEQILGARAQALLAELGPYRRIRQLFRRSTHA